MATLQETIGASSESDRQAQIRVESLTAELNQALARTAAEQRRRADAEEALRVRLEAETRDLERCREMGVPKP